MQWAYNLLVAELCVLMHKFLLVVRFRWLILFYEVCHDCAEALDSFSDVPLTPLWNNLVVENVIAELVDVLFVFEGQGLVDAIFELIWPEEGETTVDSVGEVDHVLGGELELADEPLNWENSLQVEIETD